MPEGTAADLAFEAAVNERYLAALGGAPVVMSTPVLLPANTRWTTTGAVRAHVKAYGPLVARVGLCYDDRDLGRSFYIGERRMSRGRFDAEVVSWAAPVARVFYEPLNCDHEILESVVVRRVLITSADKVVQVFDEWCGGAPPEVSPFVREELVIPPAPPGNEVRHRLPTDTRSSVVDSRPAQVPIAAPRPDATAPTPVQPPLASQPLTPAPAVSPKPQAIPKAVAQIRDGMRAAETVEFALTRPRSDALESLLATLQPDQYQMITARPDRPLLLQGHPGTGKSVIAIHRAAYLVNPVHAERGSGHDRWPDSVLFVGPTREWKEHVESAVRSLDERGAVTVMAMPDVLAALAVIKLGSGGPDPSIGDVARFVHAVVGKAVRVAKAEGLVPHPQDRVKTVQRIYDVIRAGGTQKVSLELENPDSKKWITSLPTFEVARAQARYHGLFAAIGRWIFAGHPRFAHILVDEAQDVAGLEWSLLRSLNREENWTLVGDMNQRRNDYVDSSWEGIADRLYMGAVKPRVLERGYRSTQRILDFAKPLLPRGERTAVTLQQDGPPVTVERAPTSQALASTALAQASRLMDTYRKGTVGIIAAVPDLLREEMLRSGWVRSGDNGWQKDGRMLRLLTHTNSRGVEFDGVVVVEPAAFPQNLGRSGPLYTSLTRANRELVVVNHAALPDALRRHNRSR